MESMQADALQAIALWSSANLLLMLALGLMVSRLRIQLGTGVGTGDDARLERATGPQHRGARSWAGKPARP